MSIVRPSHCCGIPVSIQHGVILPTSLYVTCPPLSLCSPLQQNWKKCEHLSWGFLSLIPTACHKTACQGCQCIIQVTPWTPCPGLAFPSSLSITQSLELLRPNPLSFTKMDNFLESQKPWNPSQEEIVSDEMELVIKSH